MRNDDEKFLRDVKFWLDQFVATLLQKVNLNVKQISRHFGTFLVSTQ